MSNREREEAKARAIRAYWARKNALEGYGAYYPKNGKGKRKNNNREFLPREDEREEYGDNLFLTVPRAPTDLGSTIGGWLGHGAQQLVKVLTGFGSYRVQENSLLSGLEGNDPPMMRNVRKGEAVVVEHREYIMDIFSASTNGPSGSAFNLQSFDIQPGLENTFPWLAQVAQGFQEYEIQGMIFEFKSLSADAVVGTNNSGALGSVIMATNYNAGAPNFTSKQEMLESEYSSDTKPSESIVHPVECKRSLTPVSRLYVRTTSVPSGQDQRLFDLGNFQIATQGMQANNAILGELWVSYQVAFYKPILGGGLSSLNVLADKYHLSSPTAANPLGTSVALVSGSTLGTTINTTANTITLPQNIMEGTFMLFVRYVGSTTATCVLPTITGGSNQITTYSAWATSGGFGLATSAPSGNVAASGSCSTTVIFSVNPGVQQVVLTFGTGGTLPTGSVFGDLVIVQCPTFTS